MIPEVKLAYYNKSDWNKLMSSIMDKDTMHDTWEEWNEASNQTKSTLESQGFIVHVMTIDIDALNKYCKENQIMNNGKTRSQYVSQLELIEKKKK